MRAVEKPTNTESNHGARGIHNHKLSPILPKLDQGRFCETKIGGSKERFAIFLWNLEPPTMDPPSSYWFPMVISCRLVTGSPFMSCAFTPLARVVTTTSASHWVRGQKNAIGSEVEKQIIALNITDDEVLIYPLVV